jgi:hypothetical protein
LPWLLRETEKENKREEARQSERRKSEEGKSWETNNNNKNDTCIIGLWSWLEL